MSLLDVIPLCVLCFAAEARVITEKPDILTGLLQPANSGQQLQEVVMNAKLDPSTTHRVCSGCGQSKLLDEFYKCSQKLLGRHYTCKLCSAIKLKKWRRDNYDKFRENVKRRYHRDIEKSRKRQKEDAARFRQNNPESVKRSREQYRSTPENEEKGRRANKRYREQNKEVLRKRRRSNERRAKLSAYLKAKRKNDPRFRLTANIRRYVCLYLRHKKRCKTFDLLPWSIDDLMNHLEAQFELGMSWDNYGKWHVDHIRPVCSFPKAGDPSSSDFQKCWGLENLRPLWAYENQVKAARYDKKRSTKLVC